VLREDEGCDLVVVLAHTGFERRLSSGETTGTAHEDFAWRLCQLEGIDVLLTGHTHESIPPQLVADTLVAQPGARGQLLTRIDLEFEHGGDGWELASWSGENMVVAMVPADDGLVRRLEETHGQVQDALSATVGHSTAAASVRGCRLGDCALLDLVHAVQLQASGADLSLAAVLSDWTPDMRPGPISRRWVHALYVYPNTLVKVRVTGAQVKDILEHTARFYDGLECQPGQGCTVVVDGDIPLYNVDSMEGLGYRVDPSRPEGDRVRDVRYRGQPLDLQADFTVVCNNYRAAGGGAYPHLATAEVLWRSEEQMTDLVGRYLTLHDPWRPTVSDNWIIAPEIVGSRPLSDRE
jgi:2',3'-cyclic-nucleotide 2'-phosphodiesterase/3'-nucleotidase